MALLCEEARGRSCRGNEFDTDTIFQRAKSWGGQRAKVDAVPPGIPTPCRLIDLVPLAFVTICTVQTLPLKRQAGGLLKSRVEPSLWQSNKS